MNPEIWSEVKRLLEHVLPLGAADRSAFLDGQKINAEVRAEVESLVAFESEASGLMDISAVEFSKDFLELNDGSLDGQMIGAYRVAGEIGHGGMGVVYLATRADGKFEQTVALKLLKREMNTTELRRRFQHEREILAGLEHQNIARLLDAGTTDDGIPFLAMEYVDGLPITQFCDQNDLGLNARLDLFRTVCGAVEFAHRNLVVHRDLKPSNILVTADGVPKLLDFGISKILSREHDAVNTATVTRMGVMTPSYASPEQLQRNSVTTQSDVYSLGVILYELLSGHRPFESKESDMRDIYHAVLESDPQPPSVVITTRSQELRELSSAPTVIKNGGPDNAETRFGAVRDTVETTTKLSPQMLRGDLDNIVLKALRKEPERRYSSVQQLSDDIDRHLQGLTVTARPNTFSYRAGKFINRNRLGVVGSALILMAVLIGIGTTLWQARVAQAERAKAEARFDEVRTLANSFLFEISPLIENLPGSTPALKLLVTRSLEYLDRLSRESTDDTGLRRELAHAYEKVGDVQGNPFKANIGDTKGALESYHKSRALRETLLAQFPADATLATDLSSVYKLIGDIESNGGEYSKSAEWYDRALVLREKAVENSPQDFEARSALAEVVRTRGLLPFYEGDNKKAIEYYTRAMQILAELATEQPGNDKIIHEYAYTFVLIGEAQGWDGETEAAGANLQKGLDMLIPLEARHPNDQNLQRSLMLAFNKRGENYVDVEQFNAGVASYEKGVAIANAMYKADLTNLRAKRDVAMSSKKLAQALDSAGRSRESLGILLLTLEMFKQMQVADPNNSETEYDVANTRFSIGETYQTLNDHGSAIETFRVARSEFDKVLAANPANIYAVRMSTYNIERLGKSYAALAKSGDEHQNLKNALEHFKTAIASFTKMKADGNLGEYDLTILDELPKSIAAIEAKLN